MTRMDIACSSQPSALRYMAQAFRPSPGWSAARGVPDICLTWHGFHIDAASLDAVIGVTDGTGADMARPLSVLLPHVGGFRLLIVLLTHAAWPLPIWGALQVRNRLLLHRPFVIGERHELQTRPLAWRVLDKGLEIDLHSRLSQGQTCFWESVVTFYYCAHADEQQQLFRRLIGRRSGHVVQQRFREMVIRLISEELPESPGGLPRAALARWLAGAFVELLAWWVEQGTEMPPAELARQFDVLARPVWEQARQKAEAIR